MTPEAALPECSWVDGQVAGEVALLDRGLHYGDGLFETIACLASGPRFPGLHLKRLSRGCERLGIPAPDAGLVRSELERAADCGRPSVVKLILTRGRALARGYGVTGTEQPTRILLRYRWQPVAAHAPGIRVRLGELRFAENPRLAGIKHLNRLEQVLARLEWSDADIAESLHCSAGGALVSGTASNVFLVVRGRLYTPRLDLAGVAGTMREVVGRLATALGVDFEKRSLGLQDVQQAEEIFLTNALTGIRPVAQLAGRSLGAGPVTGRLRQALAPLLARACEAPP